MKTHQLFCWGMLIITGCVFTIKAETTLGQLLGYVAVVISMAIFSKNMIAKMSR